MGNFNGIIGAFIHNAKEWKRWYMSASPESEALPGEWEEISQRMQVLEGEWQPCGPRPQERMVFHWKEA
jgi:hypothetical protein